MLKSLPYVRVMVKKEAAFTTEDPWNQNRRSQFSVEDSLLAPAGSRRKVWTEPFGGYLRSIRSETDGVERRLPDSLAYLWLHKRISSETLPKLLKEVEPKLRESDYKMYLRNWRVLLGFFAAPCVLLLGLLLFNIYDGSVSLPTGIAELLVAAAVIGLCLYMLLFRHVVRRKRQMKWLLERAHAAGRLVAPAGAASISS
jgi:hypothetical protein